MRFFKNKILPDEALVIPIRENHSVAILNLPHDLSQKEFEKINRIILALIDQPSKKQEPKNDTSWPITRSTNQNIPMNKEALDAAFWTYCKATGINPESHPVIEEAIRQAIEIYVSHSSKQSDFKLSESDEKLMSANREIVKSLIANKHESYCGLAPDHDGECAVTFTRDIGSKTSGEE